MMRRKEETMHAESERMAVRSAWQQNAISAKSENSKTRSLIYKSSDSTIFPTSVFRFADFSDRTIFRFSGLCFTTLRFFRLYDSSDFPISVLQLSDCSDYTILPIFGHLFYNSPIFPIVRFFLFFRIFSAMLQFFRLYDCSDSTIFRFFPIIRFFRFSDFRSTILAFFGLYNPSNFLSPPNILVFLFFYHSSDCSKNIRGHNKPFSFPYFPHYNLQCLLPIT